MEQELFQNHMTPQFYLDFSEQLFILEIASSDCFCQKSKYNACEVLLLVCLLFFYTWRLKRKIYGGIVCHM